MADQIFPVKVQKAITRLQPPGRPDIEATFHNSMEQGRFLERPLGDAMSQLKERQKDLQEKIDQYMNMNKLANDGQFPDSIRPAKYVKDAVDIVKEIQKYTQEVLNVVKAINETIGMYVSLKNNLQGYFQERINALATLLNEICNFNLPSLPSIPNFFGNFTFDGFKFPKGQFTFKLSFDKNFAFGQCRLRGGDIDIFRNYPKTMDWNGIPCTIPVYRPPLSGYIYVNGTPQNVGTIKDTPYYTDFDPNTDFYSGSGFPDPTKIVSDYHMAVDLYIERLASLTEIIFPIQNVVDSNYDPNLMAGWLILISKNRSLRQGQWLPRFQECYDQFVAPSIAYIETNGIVWNNKLNGPGPRAGDINIPLIPILKSGNATRVGQILWMLTFLETGLIGYNRNKNFDIYQLQTGTDLDSMVKNYLDPITGESTDYVQYTSSISETLVIALDSGGKAQYPTSIAVPRPLYNTLVSVITKLSVKIDQVPTFISQRPKYRYVYSNFGEQIILDKYSQYWRELADNWNTLISSNDYNSKFLLSYEQAIEETIDPLGTRVLAATINLDCDTRSHTWTPATYKLPIFIQDPLELYPPTNVVPNDAAWIGDELIEDKYLLRADIQGLDLNTKMTMMQLNRAYSVLRSNTQQMIQAIDATISGASTSSVSGFSYSLETQINDIPQIGSDLEFTVMDFDQSNYYTNGVSFKITNPGAYSLSTSVTFPNTDVGVRTVTVIKNGTQILDTKQSTPGSGPVTIDLNFTADLLTNDQIKVRVTHSCLVPQDISVASFIGTLIGSVGAVSPGPGTTTTTATQFTIITTSTISSGTCFKFNSDGTTATKLDPANSAVLPFIDGVALAGANSGTAVATAKIHGEVYTIPGSTFTAGPIFLGLDGRLTQVQPLAATGYAWYVQVGRALNATTVIMDSQLPISLL
jgi:hypothetical protein